MSKNKSQDGNCNNGDSKATNNSTRAFLDQEEKNAWFVFGAIRRGLDAVRLKKDKPCK